MGYPLLSKITLSIIIIRITGKFHVTAGALRRRLKVVRGIFHRSSEGYVGKGRDLSERFPERFGPGAPARRPLVLNAHDQRPRLLRAVRRSAGVRRRPTRGRGDVGHQDVGGLGLQDLTGHARLLHVHLNGAGLGQRGAIRRGAPRCHKRPPPPHARAGVPGAAA